MTRTSRFAQVDVFSAEPYRGNPVAVVLDAEGLADEELRRIANWTNLSETVFLLPPEAPEADYRVRILTPARELPFAGHPTLGAARAWLDAGGTPRGRDLVQECAAGLVTVRRDETAGALAFAAPPTVRSGPLDEADLDAAAAALGIAQEDVLAHQWVDNGPGWAALVLRDADAVLAVEPDPARMPGLKLGVLGAHGPSEDCAYEIRALGAGLGVSEDPVTGSLNASVAQWLLREDVGAGLPGRDLRSWTVSQGTRLGRRGRVAVSADEDGTVWIGGAARTLFSGQALLAG